MNSIIRLLYFGFLLMCGVEASASVDVTPTSVPKFQSYLDVFSRHVANGEDVSLDLKVAFLLHLEAIVMLGEMDVDSATILNEIKGKYGNWDVPFGLIFNTDTSYREVVSNPGGKIRLYAIIDQSRALAEKRGFDAWPKYNGLIMGDF